MRLCYAALFVLLFYACKPGTSTAEAGNNGKDSTAYYPVYEYFLNQVKEVDSIPFYIYRLTEQNGKKDSSGITIAQFNEWVKPFLLINTNTPAFKTNYRESVFEDQSTSSITFTYSAIDKNLPLKSLEVLLSNDGQQVKRVFITREQIKSDSLVSEKMGWKTDEQFYLNRSIQVNGKTVAKESNTIVWNKKD